MLEHVPVYRAGPLEAEVRACACASLRVDLGRVCVFFSSRELNKQSRRPPPLPQRSQSKECCTAAYSGKRRTKQPHSGNSSYNTRTTAHTHTMHRLRPTARVCFRFCERMSSNELWMTNGDDLPVAGLFCATQYPYTEYPKDGDGEPPRNDN